jgi:hypothetical protein
MKRQTANRAARLAAAGLTLIAVVLITGCATSRVSRSYVFTNKVDDLLVDMDAGDVIVTGTDRNSTKVEVDLVCKGGDPGHSVDLADGRLDVETHANWRGEGACGGTVRIETPKRASVDVSVGRGDVAVNGVEGQVQVETFEGDIECDGKTDQIAMKTIDSGLSSGPGIIFQ